MMPPSRPWKQLQDRLVAGELKLDKKAIANHSGDKWFATANPEAVALPRSVKSVSTIMRFANRHQIPVTPRGAGFGYVGGCVPLNGGIALSTARMRRIKEIDANDFVAVVQPGVITADLQNKTEAKGLYYPPDPASRADCSIGGNIATNAGGPRCLKYGVTSDYVLGLEVVLPDGAVARFGGRTHKNKTGFDFSRFFTGTEGMLAITTEATLKLLPLPPYRAALSVGFGSVRMAIRGINTIFKAGYLPSALELADEFTLRAAKNRTGNKCFSGCRGHLIVELDGQEKSVRSELPDLKKLLRQLNPRFLDQALGEGEVESIWQLRREFSYALRDTGLVKLNEDIVVPRGRLEELLVFTAKLQKKHDMPVACFGHAGDGNIHVNVMLDDKKNGHEKNRIMALDELFAWVVAHDGMITGEHGIGVAKKRWWPLATSVEVRKLHHAVKKALDPKGIMNPGKFL
jgi:glycolate oxidase subunit GlcD